MTCSFSFYYFRMGIFSVKSQWSPCQSCHFAENQNVNKAWLAILVFSALSVANSTTFKPILSVKVDSNVTKRFQSAQAQPVPEKQLKHVSLRVEDGVAVITLDSPNVKMNSLNQEVMADMEAIFNEVQSRSDIRAAVLISGKVGCFIAGADINMIEGCRSAEEAQSLSKGCQDFLSRVESSAKPIVAAIMGPCLGGGLETAMACHYRIAVDGKPFSDCQILCKWIFIIQAAN